MVATSVNGFALFRLRFQDTEFSCVFLDGIEWRNDNVISAGTVALSTLVCTFPAAALMLCFVCTALGQYQQHGAKSNFLTRSPSLEGLNISDKKLEGQ